MGTYHEYGYIYDYKKLIEISHIECIGNRVPKIQICRGQRRLSTIIYVNLIEK